MCLWEEQEIICFQIGAGDALRIFMLDSEKERTSIFVEVRSVSLKNICRFILDIALLWVFSEYFLMFQFVVCRTGRIYIHLLDQTHARILDRVASVMK